MNGKNTLNPTPEFKKAIDNMSCLELEWAWAFQETLAGEKFITCMDTDDCAYFRRVLTETHRADKAAHAEVMSTVSEEGKKRARLYWINRYRENKPQAPVK